MQSMDDRELVDLALRFAGEVNALQRRYSRLLEERREPEAGGATAVLAGFRAEMMALYDRWLTRRERSYYTPLSSSPAFAGLEGLTLSTVMRKKNRAVVELLTSEGRLDFQFNFVYKDGEWRINSYKQRCHSERRIYHWTYGDF